MKRLVQSVRNGDLRVIESPDPAPDPTEVVVATTYSLISAGTERAVRQLASSSLLSKAIARPDLVRQLVNRLTTDGLNATRQTVATRLNEEMPLGYSAAGKVLAVGEAVHSVRPGMRVATASVGHGDRQVVPGLLAVPIPDQVNDREAAFSAVGAIALHGLRQADIQIGGTVVVIGLGLVGQITLRLAAAAGLQGIGIDLQDHLVDQARLTGANAYVESGLATTEAVLEATRGRGADAVILAASTPSAEPVTRATHLLRDRGRVVVVGDVGLDLPRRPFYEKELEIRFSRSYGPGRYERTYEDYGVDYPVGFLRWTEGRNIESFLDLLATGRLAVEDLISRTYLIEEATEAYSALKDRETIGVLFEYTESRADEPVRSQPEQNRISNPKHLGAHLGEPVLGMVGAGRFVETTLLPNLTRGGFNKPAVISSKNGTNAARLAYKFQISDVVENLDAILAMQHVDTIFIASSHESHSELAVAALKAGKHVFVEKPLAISDEQLQNLEKASQDAQGLLWPGFNRRYSEALIKAKEVLQPISGPVNMAYLVNAGTLPRDHWYHDRRQGGRLLGEVCHFIDAMSWVIRQVPSHIACVGDNTGELALSENLTLLIGYPDGSSGSITYSSNGSTRTSKESLYILGQGHTVRIENYRSLYVDGRRVKIRAKDKGHVANLEAFRKAIKNGAISPWEQNLQFETTRYTLLALHHLTQRMLSPAPES